MIIRLKHVKRVVVKGRAYFYHQITKERLPDDREERAARVREEVRELCQAFPAPGVPLR